MSSTKRPETPNNPPTRAAEKPNSTPAYSGSMPCRAVRYICMLKVATISATNVALRSGRTSETFPHQAILPTLARTVSFRASSEVTNTARATAA